MKYCDFWKKKKNKDFAPGDYFRGNRQGGSLGQSSKELICQNPILPRYRLQITINMNCIFPRPHASIRIFCFPWAGGGASFYTKWGKDVTEEVEVCALCLPGRENRFKDSCCDSAKDTIDEIVKTINENYSDKPFVFYGHSMGALLAFLAASKLKQLYNKEPEHMFLSGTIAPHSPMRPPTIVRVKNISKDEFVEKLRKLGGTPLEILDNPQLMEVFLPALYADFSMVEDLNYEHDSGAKPPLSCSIDYFDGEDDIDHDIPAWKQVTSGPFTFSKMPGGHFFLKDQNNTRKLINCINLRYSGYGDIV